MGKLFFTAAALAAALLNNAASASEVELPLFTFRGLEIGTTLEEAVAAGIVLENCTAEKRWCDLKDTMVAGRVETTWSGARFTDREFDGLTLQFWYRNYGTMLSVLTAAYGAPCVSRTSDAQLFRMLCRLTACSCAFPPV